MRLTSFTDFGLRALMRLAGDPGCMLNTGDLARELGVSRNHLTKVVQALAAGGLVVTRRGTRGGFELARSADEITLGDAVRLLESNQTLVECFRDDGGSCTLTARCRLKSRLAAAREAFLIELDATTLADCAYPPRSVNVIEPRSSGDGGGSSVHRSSGR
ncbi:MAG: Rrf2 family transcriptional regulator [Proteobacteria bacterium]|nr:MAG: Rrf2 family transcriptional regulator [Pseudomonadota bacterium]